MVDLKDKHLCCGCSACCQACPKHCIKLETDIEGFKYPKVNQQECIGCGLCEKVCPFLNPQEPRLHPIYICAAKCNDDELRKKSSSGGIFSLFAEKIIEEGGVVFGACFDKNWNVIHDYTDSHDGIAAFRGSKYVQSDLKDSFQCVKFFLDKNRRVLFTGTPCQVAGLKKYLRKDYGNNLLTVDFVCHGVPSPGVWKKYIEEKINSFKSIYNLNIGLSSLNTMSVINDIKFKDKSHGWRKSRFVICYAKPLCIGKKKHVQSSVFNESEWGIPFIQNLFLRPSCYKCKVKEFRSGSDATIADFWGVEKKIPLLDDDNGTSAVVIHSNLGLSYFDKLNVEKIKVEVDDIIEGNHSIIESPQEHIKRKYFFENYKKKNLIGLFNECCSKKGENNVKSHVKDILKTCFPYFRYLKKYYNKRKENIRLEIDLSLALLFAHMYRGKSGYDAIVIPADSICGGFGEDIMIYGFLHGFNKKTTIYIQQVEQRKYLQEHFDIEIRSGLNGKWPYLSALKELIRHKNLYVIGADILDGVYKNNIIRFNIIKIAHLLGLNIHVTGFSVRELPSSYFVKKMKEIAAYTEIKARDIYSFRRLEKILGIGNVTLVSDIAFLCPTPNCDIDISTQDWICQKRRKGKKIIAYCPNTIQADKIGLAQYIKEQRTLLEEFVMKNCSILFLYHDLRKYVLDINDKELSKMISFYFPREGYFVDSIVDGVELKRYILEADFTVTGRMHFGISGLTLKKPMFGVCYYNKFEGLQKMFGIDTNSTLINYNNVNQELIVVSRFFEKYAENLNNIQSNLPKILNLAKLNF